MAEAPKRASLYPTRSGAGALLGQQLVARGYTHCLLLGITPEGVEVAANAAKAMAAPFDVLVASFIRLGSNLAPIGAMAESSPAEMDPDFQPGMNLLEKLQSAIDECEGFQKYLVDTLDRISQRAKLQGVVFDKRIAAETLRLYLGN